jgi:hypothetical protein
MCNICDKYSLMGEKKSRARLHYGVKLVDASENNDLSF